MTGNICRSDRTANGQRPRGVTWTERIVSFSTMRDQPPSPAPYRPTIFDRHGPAAADRIRAGIYGAMVFGLAFGAVALAARRISFIVIVVAAVAGLGAAMAALSLGGAAGGVARAFTMGTATTPYEEQYSYQQALVMQGKVNEALASFEDLIAASPEAVQPRVKAAELYARHDGARRAAELLREAQRSPRLTAGEDVYVTNRLVDLLAGPLGDPGRACVELRKLIDRYPGSANAARAREALARIKESMRS
jgi:hypothetical protein